jgi:hypothetical protein
LAVELDNGHSDTFSGGPGEAMAMKDFGQDFERHVDKDRLGAALSGRKERRRRAPLLGRRRGGTGRGGGGVALSDRRGF